MVKLFLKKRDEGTLIYGVASWYRAAFGIFGLVVFTGTYLSGDQIPVSWYSFPMLFSYFCVFAALYEERWQFILPERRILHRYGILVLAKTHEYSLDDAECLLLKQFRKGGLSSFGLKGGGRNVHLSLQLVMKQGEPVVIEQISRRRSAGQTEEAARAAADHLGIPLKTENLPLGH